MSGTREGAAMNILALDLGTNCGWALIEHRGIESGVQVFDLKRGESPGMRYVRFRRWLSDAAIRRDGILSIYPAIIVYEQTHHRGGAATEVGAGFATRVQEFCAEHGIEHAAVHSATLKKFTTGSGRGDKTAMRDAAIGKGWVAPPVTDDNEVDALCLLHYALAELVAP